MERGDIAEIARRVGLPYRVVYNRIARIVRPDAHMKAIEAAYKEIVREREAAEKKIEEMRK